MMQSIFNDSLIALGLWLAASLITVVLGALIAWTIVSLLRRREKDPDRKVHDPKGKVPLRPWCSGWTDGTVEWSPAPVPSTNRRRRDQQATSCLPSVARQRSLQPSSD